MPHDSNASAWAQQLRAEVLEKARGISDDDAPRFLEEAFTEWVIEVLAESGAANEGPTCYFEKPFRNSTARAHAYAVSDNADVLDLFTVILSGTEEPQDVPKAAVEGAVKKVLNVWNGAISGSFDRLEQAHDTWDMVTRIKEVASTVDKVRIFVATDGIVQGYRRGSKALKVKGIDKVEVNIWDLERFSRLQGSGRNRESIEVDLLSDFGGGLPCLPVPVQSTDYQSFLVVVPGTFLHRIYDEYGERLLELNVRSFLQARGKINKGIRDTINNKPSMFFAYNNGITATAETVTTDAASDGHRQITYIKGLQIVNGGQTTASIHRAAAKDQADVSGIHVQMKLSVIAREDLVETMVSDISHYANSQNKVSEADFSANDPYHQDLEKLSRETWTPNGQSTWFYERARGAYQVARAKFGATPAKQRQFDSTSPLAQMMTKTDVAAAEHCWGRFPHLVSKGAQKNFIEFMLRRKGSGDRVDEQAFKILVAKVILHRTLQRVAREEFIGAYRANVVAYSMSWIAQRLSDYIDLLSIWRSQAVPEALVMLGRDLVKPMFDFLVASAAGRNVTEWCKKEECWRLVSAMTFDLDLENERRILGRRAQSSAPSDAGPAAAPSGGEFPAAVSRAVRQASSVKEAVVLCDPALATPRCERCAQSAHTVLEVTAEGVLVRCRDCQHHGFLDAGFLQRVADALRATCYLCQKAGLVSQRVGYGVRLRCLQCETNNSWWKVDERLRRGEL